MSAPLQPVLDLFKELQGENSYVKVVGNPIFSVSALLNKEIKALDQGPSSSLLRALYRVKGHIDLLFDAAASVRWWQPRKMHDVVRDLDQAALNWAFNDGYLPDAPSVVVVPGKNILHKNRLPALYLEISDEVRMVSDKKGELGLMQHVKKWNDQKTDVNASIDMTKSTENPSISRLMALFHEARHHVFSHTKSPFVAPEGFDPVAAAHLNDWIFSHNVANVARKAFNEIFADTYGAMMTIKGLNFSEEAIDTVREFANLRIEMDAIGRISTKKSLMAELYQNAHKNEGSIHVGGESVLDLLDRMEQWKNMAPDDMKQLALKISSEGLVRWLSPKHLDIHVEGEKHRLLKLGNKVNPLLSGDMPKFKEMISVQMSNELLYATAREKRFHPCQEDISSVLDQVKNRLKNDFSKKSLQENGILQVLTYVVLAKLKYDKALKKVDTEEGRFYRDRAERFEEKSKAAGEIIQKGFYNFYKNHNMKQTQIVKLKGRSASL